MSYVVCRMSYVAEIGYRKKKGLRWVRVVVVLINMRSFTKRFLITPITILKRDGVIRMLLFIPSLFHSSIHRKSYISSVGI